MANGQGFLGVVGHQDAAGVAAFEQVGKLAPQPQAHLHIQVGEGFIQQQHSRFGSEGPHQGQPLALAPRELVGVALVHAGKAEQVQQPPHPIGGLPPFQAKAGVSPGIEMGKQGVVLKHHPHPSALSRQPMARAGNLAAMDHDATAAGALKAGNQPQQGGFARAGGAKQAE